MANTLTNLLPDIYAALEVVSREMVGFIPNCTRNAGVESAAQGETVRWPVAPTVASGTTLTPSMTIPALNDVTIPNRTITLNTAKYVPVSFNGEEQKGLGNAGIYNNIVQQSFEQGFRVLINEMEVAIGTAAVLGASRGHGTAGTAPFASDLTGFGAMKEILDYNGAPVANRKLVIDGKAGYNLAKLTQLTNVNQAGSNDLLRNGQFGRVLGFDVSESAGVKLHTAGTQTLSDTVGINAVGTTTIAYDGGDGGTQLAGDLLEFTGDTTGPGGTTNKYVLTRALTAAAGDWIIAKPGLVRVSAAHDEGVIIGASSTWRANMAFTPDFLVLGCRPPARPVDGDAALDAKVVTDPNTGISFLVASYGGFMAHLYTISILWGVATGNPAHGAILLG